MVFGFDPIKMAKDKLKAMDINHNNKPDVIEAMDAAEAGLKFVADFLDDVDAEEAFAILSALNSFRKPEKRRDPKEIHAAAGQLVLVPGALRKAAEALEAAEKQLK